MTPIVALTRSALLPSLGARVTDDMSYRLRIFSASSTLMFSLNKATTEMFAGAMPYRKYYWGRQRRVHREGLVGDTIHRRAFVYVALPRVQHRSRDHHRQRRWLLRFA
jgi:hypothetical protein